MKSGFFRVMLLVLLSFLLFSDFPFAKIEAASHRQVDFSICSDIKLLNNNTLDFGTIAKGSKGKAEFAYTNTGGPNDGIIYLTLTSHSFWISLSPESLLIRPGQTREFTITLDTSSLSLGTTKGSFTIYAPSTNEPEVKYYVQVEVVDNTLDFGEATKGQEKEKAERWTNRGSQGSITLSYISNNSWIKINPTRHTVQPGQTVTFTISVKTSDLSLGINTGSVTVLAPGSNAPEQTYFIKINVLEPSPKISIEEKSMDFGVVEVGEISEKKLRVHNTGGGSLDVRCRIREEWLFVEPESFTVQASKYQDVEVIIDARYLEVGLHKGSVFFSSNGGSQRIEILVEIKEPDPSIKIEPSQIDLGDITTNDLIQRDIKVTNTGGGILTGQIQASAEWINLNTNRFSLKKGESALVKITINPMLMKTGLYKDNIQFSANTSTMKIVIIANKIDTSPRITIYDNQIDFGDVAKSHKIDQFLTIINSGQEALTGKIQVGSTALYTDPISFHIQPSSKQNIKVTLTASLISSSGNWDSKLHIQSNDPDQPELTIPITAYLLHPPKLKLPTKTLSFGQVAPGLSSGSNSSVTLTLSFANTGEEDLEILFTSSPSWLSITPASCVINAQSSREISFHIISDRLDTLEKYGFLEALVHGTSNDPEKASFNLTFTAIHGILLKLRIGSNTAIINQDPYLLDVPPQIIQGRTLVPLRFISETFGIEIKWIPHPTNEIQLTYQEKLVHLWIGRKEVIIEYPGMPHKPPEKLPLDVPPQIIQGRTLVPLRFISETFGAKVDWHAPTQEITIKWVG